MSFSVQSQLWCIYYFIDKVLQSNSRFCKIICFRETHVAFASFIYNVIGEGVFLSVSSCLLLICSFIDASRRIISV